IVIPPAIFFYYSTLFDSRFKTLQQNQEYSSFPQKKPFHKTASPLRIACRIRYRVSPWQIPP
ncbi:hypothetical protein, partial [Enterococcus faecium]|uniref:hypothetical protein n=1 Tax=Enterococcus faecium TaxID=1352 RepID=UPI002B468CD4